MNQDATVTDIITQLNKTVLTNVNTVVEPLVTLINTSKRRDVIITDLLKSLPEYKLLLAENNCFHFALVMRKYLKKEKRKAEIL